MIPAVIYTAKSTEDVHESLVTQLQEARELCEENGWTIVGTYQDEGFSAYSGNRGQGLEDAERHAGRAAAEHGTVCMLVGQAHDRFARGAGDKPGAPQSLGELWHRTRRQDVHLRTVEDDEELRDEASVAAIGRRAHIDSKRKSKSVSKGLKRRRAKGLHTGGKRKFGYLYASYEDGRTIPDRPMEPHPTEREDFLWMVAQVVDHGVSMRQVAKDLDKQGVRGTRGNRFHYSSVRVILADPFYAGKLRVRGSDELIDGQHQPLITWERHEQLQKAFKGPQANGGRKPVERDPIFQNGHLRCGRCGGSMGYRSRRNAHSVWERYVCTDRERWGTEHCEQLPVPFRGIELAAHRLLVEYTGSGLAEAHGIQDARRADVELTQARLTEARQQTARVEARLKRVTTDYQAGDLSAKRYEPMAEELESELAAAYAQVEQLSVHRNELETAATVDVQAVMLQAMGNLERKLAAALEGADVPAARALFRRAFPEVTLHQADGRTWLDLGAPAKDWVEAEISDELGAAHSGEPVLARTATSDYNGLPYWSLVGEVTEEAKA